MPVKCVVHRMVALFLLCMSSQLFAAPPNVVIVLADDQGWGDLGIHGNTNIATPNIDNLAREGALFSRFYVSPVCAPTRGELLTGRYHFRTGVRGVTRGRGRLNLDESTFFDMFSAAGYTTGMFGKWHNGTQDLYHPNEHVSETITAKVTVAHDPPLLGKDEDRVPRGGESYMKHFKPMTIGRIKLTEDIGILTLRALNVPGASVMECGTLVLTQVDTE